MALPSDPIMLLSVVNLKLRDFYPSLDALCDDLDADQTALCASLAAVGTNTTQHGISLCNRRMPPFVILYLRL